MFLLFINKMSLKVVSFCVFCFQNVKRNLQALDVEKVEHLRFLVCVAQCAAAVALSSWEVQVMHVCTDFHFCDLWVT